MFDLAIDIRDKPARPLCSLIAYLSKNMETENKKPKFLHNTNIDFEFIVKKCEQSIIKSFEFIAFLVYTGFKHFSHNSKNNLKIT